MKEQKDKSEVWLSRLKNRPAIAILIVVFSVLTVVLDAPVKLLESYQKLRAYWREDVSTDRAKQQKMFAAYSLGQHVEAISHFGEKLNKTSDEAEQKEIKESLSIVRARARTELSLLGIPVASDDLMASGLFESVLHQTLGEDIAKSYVLGFRTEALWTASLWYSQKLNEEYCAELVQVYNRSTELNTSFAPGLSWPEEQKDRNMECNLMALNGLRYKSVIEHLMQTMIGNFDNPWRH